MLFLRALLFIISFGFLCVSAVVVLYDVYLACELNRILRRDDTARESPEGAAQQAPASAPEGPPPPPRPAFHLPPDSARPPRAIRWSIAAKLIIAVRALARLRMVSYTCARVADIERRHS